MSSQRDRRIRTPNKRYKDEEDEPANIDIEEDIEVDDEDFVQADDQVQEVGELEDRDDGQNDGELHETNDPNIFHCSDEKPTYFYLELLERAERDDLGLSDNVVNPPSGSIVIYNVNRYTLNGRVGLDHEKIRRCMRIDGYRLFNAGTHKVARSIILARMSAGNGGHKVGTSVLEMSGRKGERTAYRSYNTLYNVKDPRKIDPRFKRKEYWYADGACVLFHYLGDDEIAKRVASSTPHGNSRRSFAVYQRTDPMILHEARTKIMAGEKPEDIFNSMRVQSDPSRVLKNIKQLRNVKERIDQERKRKAQAFYNIHTLHDMLRFEGTRMPFLHNISAIRIVAQLVCEPLIEEFINTVNLNASDGMTQVLFYDTTFNTCGYQVCLLSFRHDIFDEDPPVPLGFLVGETLTPRDHVSLFEALLECFPRLKSLPMAIASTVPLKLGHFWPELIEIRAWNDAKFQLKREFISTLRLSNHDWRNVMRAFEELTSIETEAAFDRKWYALRERLDPAVVDLMEERTIPEWKELSAPWTLDQHRIKYKDTRGITRIPLGSFDYLINAMTEAKMSIDGVIATLFYLCQFTINEMERGYYQLGSFTIKDNWLSLTDDPHNIPRQPFAPYPDEIITFVNEVALNTAYPLSKRKRLTLGAHHAAMHNQQPTAQQQPAHPRPRDDWE